MHIINRLLFLLLLTFCFSCEEKGWFVQCSDCLVDEPLTTDISVKLDPDNYYGAEINIWEGYVEDGILVGQYIAITKTFSENVILNKTYTITVTYQIANDTYIAVDSATPRVRYEKSQCDEPCYFIYDKEYDLRLKYTR